MNDLGRRASFLGRLQHIPYEARPGRFPREIFITLPNVVYLRPNPSLLWYYLRHLCLLSFRVTPRWLMVVHTLLTCEKRGEMGGVRFYLNPGFLFFPGQVGEMSR